MPRKFQKVYLHDNYPSDISACMTIRESLWNIVSTLESEEFGGSVDYSMDCGTDSLSMKDSYDLPLSFGKQPPLKKVKRKQKNKNSTVSKGIDQKFLEFSETRCPQNVFMGYNEVCLFIE